MPEATPVLPELVTFPCVEFWTRSGPKHIASAAVLEEEALKEKEFWESLGLGATSAPAESKAFGTLPAAIGAVLGRLRNAQQAVNVQRLSPLEYLQQAIQHYQGTVQSNGLTQVTPGQFATIEAARATFASATVCRNVLEFLAKGSNANEVKLSLQHVSLLAKLWVLTEPASVSSDVVRAIERQLVQASAARDQIVTELEGARATIQARLTQANAEATAELRKLVELTQNAQSALTETKQQAAELKRWFDETLPTTEVVKLWETKEQKHQRGFTRWLVGSAMLMSLFGCYLATHPPTFAVPPSAADIGGALRWAVGLSLAVWLSRLGLRFAVNHQRLREDARERAVMASTFMSLDRTKPLDTTLKASVICPRFSVRVALKAVATKVPFF